MKFKKAETTKSMRRIIKQLGMESYEYNGYLDRYGLLYFTRKLNEKNTVLATCTLMEHGKDVMFSYGTEFKVLDAFMLEYLETQTIDKTMEEVVKHGYTAELDKELAKNPLVKQFLGQAKVLYVRDSRLGENKTPIDYVDIYFVAENDDFISFPSVHFVISQQNKKPLFNGTNIITVSKEIL